MNWVMNLYNTNATFHSFIVAMEMAIVSFVTSYQGGMPTTKSAWISLACAAGGAVWGALKRYLATNVATVGVTTK
jgi:hypothetical protein